MHHKRTRLCMHVLHCTVMLANPRGWRVCSMLPMGQIRCGGPAVIVAHPLCHCDNCAGTGEAYALASLWSIARSPLLFGGDLPADAQTLSMLTNPDFFDPLEGKEPDRFRIRAGQ